MDASASFIRSITINKVRHLSDITIEIDRNRPRHLILTGPNGCGKTSVLRFIEKYLSGVPNKQLMQLDDWRTAAGQFLKQASALREQLKTEGATLSDKQRRAIDNSRLQAEQHHRHFESLVVNYQDLTLDISSLATAQEQYEKGEFLIAFFGAKRSAQIEAVSGAQKINLQKVNSIAVQSGSPGSKFLQFLVNQENRAALLQRKGDAAGVAEIESWLQNLTAKFRQLFRNDELVLDYDIDNFDFKIKMPGREPFRLVDNQLSDGFSAVIQIVVELLLRMEAVSPGRYDLPGIVLIDEIETHLHIEMQKAILPFLTGFFPNIQFIVTTHSPFVLTSLPDSVVFDLESKKRWEHLAPMSASTVVEEYFDSDLYSTESKRMIGRYAELTQSKIRTDQENAELESLRQQLDILESEQAPELVAQYRQLRARELAS